MRYFINFSHSNIAHLMKLIHRHCFIICSWNLDPPLCWRQSPWGFPHEVPKTAATNQTAPVCPQWRDHHLVHLRDNQPSP